jgi:polysaccharide export outer membrane protein
MGRAKERGARDDVPNAVRTSVRALLAALAVAGAFTLAGPVRAQAPATNAAANTTTLNPGDVVRITVWRKPELSGDFVVARDGTLSHPLLREVRVTGIPVEQVDARIREFLATLEANPQFVIEPLLRVAVSGEVRTPNLYNLRPETSISQAVAVAGGTTERGRRDRVVLVRQNRQMVVNFHRPDETGAGMLIRSGDQIMVEQGTSLWRDVIGPVVSVLGATAAIVSVILYNGHR